MSESKKSTDLYGGPYACTTTYISSDNNSGAKTLIEYDIDETLDIKEEIIQDNEIHQRGEHHLLSEKNQSDAKFITTEISSDNDSGTKTLIEYDIDEKLDIKEEIIQDQEIHQRGEQNLLSERNQLDEKCMTTEISSYNNSGTKTLIEYDINEKLNIKKEITQDNKIHQSGEHHLLSERNHMNQKFITTEIFSDNNSRAQTLNCRMKNDNDKTLNIKKEMIQELGTTSQKRTKKYKSNLCTVDRKEADNLAVINKLQTCKKEKIQESRHKPEKKYKCKKCDRSYTLKKLLNRSQYAAVKQQFTCDFCEHKTNRKRSLSEHNASRHLQASTRNYCDKCSRSYTLLKNLNSHKRVEHAANKPKFTCDFCGHETKRKRNMSQHIISRHLQTSQISHYCDKFSRSYTLLKNVYYHKRVEDAAVKPQYYTYDSFGHKMNPKGSLSKQITSRFLQTSESRHYCDKCSRSYTLLKNLNSHKRVEHAAVKPEFTCNFCGHKTIRKSDLSQHITSRHLQTSNTRHHCDKCPRSYTRLYDLNYHKRLEHAAVKPLFTCDFCGHKTNMKRSLSKHMTSRHLQTSKTRHLTRHYCDKCSRSYTRLNNLNHHKCVEHAAVKPEFTCDFFRHKTNRKSDLPQHITSRHLQTSKTRHYCDKCSRSYTRLDSLNYHKRSKHAAVNPLFTCDFCGHKTNRKSDLSKHITSRHLQTSRTRHYCDKCSRSYTRLYDLNYHKRLKHAVIIPLFTCDFCGHKTNSKSSLSEHIASRHLQASKTRHYCNKCSRSYTRSNGLNYHKLIKHAAVKPEFTCDFCGHKTNRKGDLSQHITSRHLETSNTRHHCDKCSRSYIRLYDLNYHKRLKHAAVNPQFTCDSSEYKTNRKSYVSKHITSRHIQMSETRYSTRHFCNKCSRSYTHLKHLNRHERLKHTAVKL